MTLAAAACSSSGDGVDADARASDASVAIDAAERDAAVNPPEDLAPSYPRVIFRSDCVASLSGRLISQHETAAVDKFQLIVRHMGKPGTAESLQEVSNPVTWDVGTYTGFAVPEPRASWQRGFKDEGPPIGTNAFQLQCEHAGSMINSWSFDHTVPVVGGGPNAVWQIVASAPSTPFGSPSSALVVEADLAVPWIASWKGGVGQLSFFVYLREQGSGRFFAYVLGMFDSRAPGDNNGTEFLGNDTFVSFVSSPLLPGMRYSTIAPGDPQFKNAAFATPQHFRVSINVSQLLAAVDDLNAKGEGPALSRTPTDYQLHSAGVLHEIFVGTDPETNLSMGVGIDKFVVSEAR